MKLGYAVYMALSLVQEPDRYCLGYGCEPDPPAATVLEDFDQADVVALGYLLDARRHTVASTFSSSDELHGEIQVLHTLKGEHRPSLRIKAREYASFSSGCILRPTQSLRDYWKQQALYAANYRGPIGAAPRLYQQDVVPGTLSLFALSRNSNDRDDTHYPLAVHVLDTPEQRAALRNDLRHWGRHAEVDWSRWMPSRITTPPSRQWPNGNLAAARALPP